MPDRAQYEEPRTDGGRNELPDPQRRDPGQYDGTEAAHHYAKAAQHLERGAELDDDQNRIEHALDTADQVEKLEDAAAREGQP